MARRPSLIDLVLRRAAVAAPRLAPYPRLPSDFVHGAIFRQGDPASTLCLVSEGALEVRVAIAMGVEIAVNRLGAGDLFGEMSLLTGEPRSASVVALTDAALYEFRKEHLSPMPGSAPSSARPSPI